MKCEVVRGMFDLGVEETESAKSVYRSIIRHITEIKNSYIHLGFQLDVFKRNEHYKKFGYLTFEEFCEKNVPLEMKNIHKCLRVFYRFAKIQGNARLNELDEKYVEYNYSQLCEMLPLTESELEEVTPEMSVKKIRNLKKTLKEQSNENQNIGGDVATTSKKEDDPEKEFVKNDEKEKWEFYVGDFMEELYAFLESRYNLVGIEVSGKSVFFAKAEGDKFKNFRLVLSESKQ